jgi:hypothetical protein
VFWGDPSHPQTCIYRLKGSGVHFHEHIIDSGKGGEAVEITQITDVHFNICDDMDRADPELAYTEQCRKWLAGGVSKKGIEKAMEFASFTDQTVITGDTLDYLSHGSLEMMKEYLDFLGATKLAMPKIASGLDKLSWDNVYDIICEVFEDMDIDIVICEI